MTFRKFCSTKGVISALLIISWLASCVPARQFDELKQKENDCQAENSKLNSKNHDLNTELTELKANMEKLSKEVNTLVNDTNECGIELRRIIGLNDELTKSYDKLLANNEKMLAGNSEETKKLVGQ